MTRHVPFQAHLDALRDRAGRPRCLTRSCTCTWRPATPCSTAPRTRTSSSSGPSSRRWTPSPSPTATAPTARSGSPRRACRAGCGRSSAWTSPSRRAGLRAGRPARRPAAAAHPRPAEARSATAGLPRVTFLAGSRRGWAAVCRLVSATHLAGERGDPVSTLDLVAEHVAGRHRDVLVMLGPASELGRAATLRRDDLARAALRPWLEVVDRADLLVELVSHRLPGSGPGLGPARRPDGRAGPVGRARAWCSATRSATPTGSTPRRSTCSTPPAGWCRSTCATSTGGNAEGFLKSGKQMAEVAEEICRFAGLGSTASGRPGDLLARTRAVADRCALDPRADLGLGEVHFPEFEVVTGADAAAAPDRRRGAAGPLRGGHRAPLRQRAPGSGSGSGSTTSSRSSAALGYAPYFLTVADVTDLIKDMGVRCAARGSGAGSLVNYLLGISGVDPLRHGLLMERFLSPLRQALPDIDVDVESARRLEVYEAILDRYGGERCVCVSMMDTYRVRHAIRDVGAALGMPVGEIDAIAKAFPHIRARDARIALRDLPELRASGLRRASGSTCCSGSSSGSTGCRGTSPCTRAACCSPTRRCSTAPRWRPRYAGFPMSQFDKDDVEDLGLLKLDVLGIRMQSSMAHAVDEIERLEGRAHRPRRRAAGAVRRRARPSR